MRAAQGDAPQLRQHGLSVGTQSIPLTTSPDADLCGRILALPAANVILPPGASVPNCEGFYAEFNAWIEQLPEDYAESVIAGNTPSHESGSRLTIERWVRDNFRQVYVSYAATIEPLSKPGSFRVSFGSSTVAPPKDVTAKPGWRIVEPPSYPLPQILEGTDELPLLLTTNPNGVQLVDYIDISGMTSQLGARSSRRKEAPRDSYAEDSEFALAKPALRVNGEPRSAVAFPEMLRGSVLWLYVPGEGRYIITFVPHPEFGFSKTGEVSGDLMTLIVNRNVLRIHSSDRIPPGGGIYNVYGMLDSTWQPEDPADRDRFMAGTSPAVESALPH